MPRPVTAPAGGPAPPRHRLAARPARNPPALGAGATLIFLHFVLDKSGSYEMNMEAQEKALARLIAQIKADAALADRVRLAATEMSSVVKSTRLHGGAPLRAAVPPGRRRQPARGDAARRPWTPTSSPRRPRRAAAVTIHVVMCDGQSSDDVGPAVAAYRKAQEADPDFHVFPVELGPPEWINTDFTRKISVAHEALPCPDVDAGFDATFGAVLALLDGRLPRRRPGGDRPDEEPPDVRPAGPAELPARPRRPVRAIAMAAAQTSPRCSATGTGG